jgi:hypothetical protein
MITHFEEVKLQTVSIQGVKQVYHDLLKFPIKFESEHMIVFQPAPSFKITFQKVNEPIAPVHMAFETEHSAYYYTVQNLKEAGMLLLRWPDGRDLNETKEDTRNVYFRDGDGNLLELIAHPYIREGILDPAGCLRILYLREVGLPTEDVPLFSRWLCSMLEMDTSRESDDFTFVIGGTAHAVVVSTERPWIPISMAALPPKLKITLGVSSRDDLDRVRASLSVEEYRSHTEQSLSFNKLGYDFQLAITNFGRDTPRLLNLPLSRSF